MPDAPRKRLRRISDSATARFLTFSCYRRLPLFQNDRIKDRFVEALAQATQQHAVPVLGWVIMPEHVHLIVVPAEGQSLTPFLTSLKRPVAVDVLKLWRKVDAPILARISDAGGNLHFWQAGGGYDRNVVDRELIEKTRYVHANPIQRGLCATSDAWAWSSARRYQGHANAIGPRIAFDLVPENSEELA